MYSHVIFTFIIFIQLLYNSNIYFLTLRLHIHVIIRQYCVSLFIFGITYLPEDDRKRPNHVGDLFYHGILFILSKCCAVVGIKAIKTLSGS